MRVCLCVYVTRGCWLGIQNKERYFVIIRCLEGGAEEFLLKPLQLSDLEKLQPYFLKFPDNSCEGQITSADTNNNEGNNCNKCNNISKRKAMSSEPKERSRSKMKELEVV